jgi:hypothetical protein
VLTGRFRNRIFKIANEKPQQYCRGFLIGRDKLEHFSTVFFAEAKKQMDEKAYSVLIIFSW